MKKWWIGYTGADNGVEEVEVIGQRNPEAAWGMSVVRLGDGTIDDVRTSDLHETEAAARRGRAMNEAEDLEDEARNRDVSAEFCQDAAERELVKVAEYKAEARALRARAKGLRDMLAVGWVAPSGGEGLESYPEVKDATEGRR